MKHKWLFITAMTVVASACLLSLVCSNHLQITQYCIDTDKVNSPIKFAIISDLHSSQYGKEMKQLLSAIEDGSPDAILFCGDIFDIEFDDSNTWLLLETLSQKYSCYFISGNHEIYDGLWESQKDRLQSIGITVLSGTSHEIIKGNSTVILSGVDDIEAEETEAQFETIANNTDTSKFNILLSHRPHLITRYKEVKADLVISGHAHGGQWRIPVFVPSGLYAPSQGLFPQYTTGLHNFDNWQLLVSRGLDKQAVPYPRVFNRPELIFLTIQ